VLLVEASLLTLLALLALLPDATTCDSDTQRRIELASCSCKTHHPVGTVARHIHPVFVPAPAEHRRILSAGSKTLYQRLALQEHQYTLLTKNAVFWKVTPCGSYRNCRFGGTYRFYHEYFFATCVGC
jgi:hypothetical protein